VERRDKINKEKISIRVSLSFILSLIMILLPMSCGKEVPTSPLDETVQQDIWCKLNFKLKIKANPATEETEGARFEIKAHGQNIIHTLEKELQIETKEIKEKANQLGVEIEEGKIAQYAYEKDISLTQAFHTLYFDAVAESSKNKGQADLLALLDSVDSEQKPNGKQIIDMPESPSDLSWEEINRRGAKYLDENTT